VYESVTAYGFECQRVTFKQLDGKLWEIKFKAKSGGYRIGYVMTEGDTLVWLHAFKKTTQKTPPKDLELARKRMKEVLS
jgi:phage-related protein